VSLFDIGPTVTDLLREWVLPLRAIWPNTDIPIVSDNPGKAVKPLSEYSSVVRGLQPVRKTMLYCHKEDMDEAKKRVAAAEGGTR
jgi:hypothetical protein